MTRKTNRLIIDIADNGTTALLEHWLPDLPFFAVPTIADAMRWIKQQERDGVEIESADRERNEIALEVAYADEDRKRAGYEIGSIEDERMDLARSQGKLRKTFDGRTIIDDPAIRTYRNDAMILAISKLSEAQSIITVGNARLRELERVEMRAKAPTDPRLQTLARNWSMLDQERFRSLDGQSQMQVLLLCDLEAVQRLGTDAVLPLVLSSGQLIRPVLTLDDVLGVIKTKTPTNSVKAPSRARIQA